MSLATIEQANALIVPLEIRLDQLNKLEEVIKKLRGMDANLPGGRSEKFSFDDDTVEKTLQKMLTKGVGTSGPQGVQNAMSLFQNPQGFILNLMANPYVAAAILGTASAKMILDILMLQGNILDRHFQRIIQNENNKGRRVSERQQIRAGLGRQVIITNKSGSTSPEYAINTYAQVRDGSIRTSDSFEIRKGYRF